MCVYGSIQNTIKLYLPFDYAGKTLNIFQIINFWVKENKSHILLCLWYTISVQSRIWGMQCNYFSSIAQGDRSNFLKQLKKKEEKNFNWKF